MPHNRSSAFVLRPVWRKNAMRKSSIISILSVILFSSLIAHGITQAALEQRPALEMIKWGDDYFEYPDWSASITEKDGGASGSWSRPGSVFTRRYLPQYKEMSGKQMEKFVDDKYIDGTMVEYGDYELIDRCIVGNTVILEIKADSKNLKDTTYTVRQWFWSDNDGWTDIFTAYTDKDADEFEELFNDIMGKSASCK
jgi:hypothetical protein